MSTLPLFDGRTYDAARDGKRLTSQLDAVCHLMKDGKWRTIQEIHRELRNWGIQATETSISSRVRDLRKAKFGAYRVDSRCIDNEHGLWAFRVEVIS